jgi:murein DD-endopeptidase MepM/ murein hydrolase activator NlpD
MLKSLALTFLLAVLMAAPAEAARSTGGTAPPPRSAGSDDHRQPLAGPFTYGDGFNVARTGHRHQGVDLLAPKGTPVVAPHAGTVTQVAYQRDGAGYYVVLSGSGETLDYVFMHMVKGSTRVAYGQAVTLGQRIGDVGSTGASSGTHLHFEIWKGPWAMGGKAIDPMPYLKSWAPAATSRRASRNR